MGLPGGRGALLFRGPVSRAGGAATGLSGRDGPEPAGAGTGAAAIPSDAAGPRPCARGAGGGGCRGGGPGFAAGRAGGGDDPSRAAALAEAGVVSGSVIRLTQGVLRSMFLIKLRTVAATIIAIAALAAGARVVAARSAGSPTTAQPGADPGRTGSSSRGRRRPARGARRNRPSSPGSRLDRRRPRRQAASHRAARGTIERQLREDQDMAGCPTRTCCVSTWTNSSSLSFSPVPRPAARRRSRPSR